MAHEHTIPKDRERVMRDAGIRIAQMAPQGLGHEAHVFQLQNLATFTHAVSGFGGSCRWTRA